MSLLRLRLLRCSSEPGLISIPDPIHNPGLRERGPNEEMKHRGKVAEQRGAALQRKLSSASLFTLADCPLLPDVKEGNSQASVAANYTKMCLIPQNFCFKCSLGDIVAFSIDPVFNMIGWPPVYLIKTIQQDWQTLTCT